MADIHRFLAERVRRPATPLAAPHAVGDHVVHVRSGQRGHIVEADPHRATISINGVHVVAPWCDVQADGNRDHQTAAAIDPALPDWLSNEGQAVAEECDNDGSDPNPQMEV